MPKNNKKKPLRSLLFSFSPVINFMGFAGFADGYMKWRGFLGDIVSAYVDNIRQPLLDMGQLVGLNLPSWVFDYFVIWSGMHLAFNFYFKNFGLMGLSKFRGLLTANENTVNLRDRIDITINWLLYLVCPPYFIMNILAGARKLEVQEKEFGVKPDPELLQDHLQRRKEALGLLTYTFIFFGMFVLILFLNWQFSKVA